MKRLLSLAFAIAAVTFDAPARADDITTAVVPTALVQTDFQLHPQDPQQAEGDNGFSLARFRFGVYANPVPWFFALAQAEFASGESPSVLDAFVRVGQLNGLRVNVGYSKSPLFESYRNELDGMTPFPELSMPVQALSAGRDLGIELHYTPAHLPLEAWFRFSNGNPSITENDNNDFAVTGRIDTTFARGRIDATGEERYGLRVGVGALADHTYDRAGVGGQTASGFLFYRPPTVSGERKVFEAHALAYAGPVRALIEVGEAIEDRDTSVTGNPSNARVSLDPEVSRGGSAEVAWMITGEQRVASVWPVAASKSPFAFDHPAFEVAARVERLDVGHGMRDFAPGGATGGALSASAWLNALCAFTLAGYEYKYDKGPIEEPARTHSWLVQARLTLYLNPPPLGPGAFAPRPFLTSP